MKRQSDIVTRSARFVDRLFRKQLPGWALYHNLAHTSEVVAASWEIGEGTGLSHHDMEILLVAAWFHDTGYTELAKGHEERSAAIVSAFLEENKYPRRSIARIARCILATRVPQRPKSMLERILCDADLKSLGMRSFLSQNDRLKAEIERREGVVLDDVMWLRRSCRFLRKHRFHTRYARTRFEKGRFANIARLRKLLEARNS